MVANFKYQIHLNLFNRDGIIDQLFEGVFYAQNTEELSKEPRIVDAWKSGMSQCYERNFDGTGWDLEVVCDCVEDVETGENDWINDGLPQRTHVTEDLTSHLSLIVLEEA